MKQDFYRPYFEAVKQVLEGVPVKNLEKVRRQCNRSYWRAVSSGFSKKNWGYPEAIVVSFVANAENRILMGVNPFKFYSRIQGSEAGDLRKRGIKILENVVQRYLK
jgi:hypothetical protein